MQNTIASAAQSGAFFGLAHGNETDNGELRYVGLSYGKRESLIFDLIDLSAVLLTMQAKIQFSDLVEEVVQQFTTNHNVKVEITIDISAHTPTSFDTGLQRTVEENCKVLKFKSAAFETS